MILNILPTSAIMPNTMIAEQQQGNHDQSDIFTAFFSKTWSLNCTMYRTVLYFKSILLFTGVNRATS